MIDGESLNQFIKNEDYTYNESDALEIIHDLLLALNYLHGLDYMHRDIKPANIMLQKKNNYENCTSLKSNWNIILIDFGLCAPNWDHSPNSFLHDRSGTVGYLAPELIQKDSEKKFYDKKIDVFSIGVVLVEM